MDINRINNLSTPALHNGTSHIVSRQISDSRQDVVPDTFAHQQDQKIELRKMVEQFANGESVEAEPIGTRQYADNQGRVTHLALMLDSSYAGPERGQMLDAYKTLFTKMEPDTKFTIACGSLEDKQDIQKVIKKNKIPNPARIKFFIPKGGNPTIWARDMMVSTFETEYPHKTCIINSSHLCSADGHIPSELQQKVKTIDLVTTPTLVTDGGDTVSNSRESFIGFDSIEGTKNNLRVLADMYPEFNDWAISYYTNTMKPQTEPNEKGDNRDNQDINPEQMFEDLSVRLFEDYFGKPVTPVGKDDPATDAVEKVAVFHQDMCMTPLDDKTFLLADPTLFEDMVANMTPGERMKAQQQFDNVIGPGYTYDFDQFISDSASANSPEDFEAYKKTLEDKGYNVVRVPYRFSTSEITPSFTYNNCLIENFEKDGKQVKRVFLPTIGVDVFDDSASDIYKKQGFEVITIPMGHVCKLMGELRCVTNWLERSEKA